MPTIPCMLLEGTDFARVWLRRYVHPSENGCPAEGNGGLHQARTLIAEAAPCIWDEHGGRLSYHVAEDEHPPAHDDPRWPMHCACGLAFPDSAAWQVFHSRLYALPDGSRVPLEHAPVGAIWRAEWLEDVGWIGEDGRSYVVKTPGGEWTIDAPSTAGGGKWTRTGEAPNFTVTPSILIGLRKDGSWAYHGWLRDGALVDA